MLRTIFTLIETNIFGVCTKLAERLRISLESVRLFFIYSSLLTFGSPIVLYLALAFVIEIRKHLRKARQIIRS